MTRQPIRLLAVALLAGLAAFVQLSAAPSAARADTSVAVSFFYDDLEPHGYWVEDRDYGMVWYPHERPRDWQPYVYGRWVWTADYGWYWDSDEDWGWAVYHYGRWVYTADHGWVWVPGDEWGPAWVEWRYGDGHVGWAPMPPEAAWRDSRVVYAGVDVGAPRYHASWVFVTEADFGRGDWRTRRAPRSRNADLLRASARVTNYAAVSGRIVNRSIDVGRVSAAAKLKIAPAKVVVAQSIFASGPRARAAGQVSIYRPRVVAKARLRAEPPRVEIDERFESEGRIEAEERIETRPRGGASVGGSVGTSGNIGIGGGGGVGIGGGVGVGGGGGLRIGR